MTKNAVVTQPLIGWIMEYLWQVDNISQTTGQIISHGIDANELMTYCFNEIESGRKDVVALADQHYKSARKSSLTLEAGHVKNTVYALCINAAVAYRFANKNAMDEALTYGLRVAELFGMFCSTLNLTEHVLENYHQLEKLDTSFRARQNGLKSHANDPKKTELNEVRKEWEKVKHQKRYKADFARRMVEKYKVLQSTKYLEDMCRKWEKEEDKKV